MTTSHIILHVNSRFLFSSFFSSIFVDIHLFSKNKWHSFLTIPPLKADLLTGTTHSKTGFTPEDIWLQMRIMPTKMIVKGQCYQPTLHRSGRGLMMETGV